MPHDRGIFFGLTVAEHFHLDGVPQIDEQAAAFERFPLLYELRNRRAGLLSGGEQQMLALARALVRKPRLLLLDELSLGLAPIILDAALAADAEPLGALAAAYRAFALAHPHLYRLMTDQPLQRDLLPAGVEDRAAAPLLRAAGDPDRARAVWAFAHGMIMLELAGRFPPSADLDAAWQQGTARRSGRRSATNASGR